MKKRADILKMVTGLENGWIFFIPFFLFLARLLRYNPYTL